MIVIIAIVSVIVIVIAIVFPTRGRWRECPAIHNSIDTIQASYEAVSYVLFIAFPVALHYISYHTSKEPELSLKRLVDTTR
jgi:hypothetical protein